DGLFGEARGSELRAGDFRNGDAEVKHRAGEVFGGVDLAFGAKDFLGAGDPNVIRELVAVGAKAGAMPCAGEPRHPGAASSAVEVDAEPGAEAAQPQEFGRENF